MFATTQPVRNTKNKKRLWPVRFCGQTDLWIISLKLFLSVYATISQIYINFYEHPHEICLTQFIKRNNNCSRWVMMEVVTQSLRYRSRINWRKYFVIHARLWMTYTRFPCSTQILLYQDWPWGCWWTYPFWDKTSGRGRICWLRRTCYCRIDDVTSRDYVCPT